MRGVRIVAVVLAAALLPLAGAAADTGTSTPPIEAGFGVRSILPAPDNYDEVWTTTRRRPTGVLPGDGLWAHAAFVSDGDDRLGIVSLDLLGFFYEDAVAVRDEVRRVLGPDVRVLVASTHTHASPDTLGIYGPDEVTSGINPDYQAFVRTQAARAVIDAAGAAVPVTVTLGQKPAPSGLNEYDESRYPGTFDDDVHVLRFDDVDGRAVGTVVNWASHPELIDPRSSSDPGIPEDIRGSILSSDFVHTLRETVEAGGGGTTVFLNGPVGAVTGLAMPIVDPDTGEVFPRRSVKKAYHVGRQVGAAALDAVSSPEAVTLPSGDLEVSSAELFLEVDNPFILALKAAGVVDRPTYTAGVEHPAGRDVKTEMFRIALGPLEILTVPGELLPDVYTGVYQPAHEQANPDVPPERAIRPQMTGTMRFVVGLAQDELGYFVSATAYMPPSIVNPVYGEGVDRNGREHYHETLSLGRDTARSISQWSSRLLGLEPEPDYEPYSGGFLDSSGQPLYDGPTADVRGIWADTSDSGRFERGADAQLVTPLPSALPAAYGFLDAHLRDMGPEPSTAARGVWVDGNGDGVFDPLTDVHLSFDSYIVGPGEIEP